MVYMNHSSDGIYEQIPLYENTVKVQQKLAVKLLDSNDAVAIYDERRDVHPKRPSTDCEIQDRGRQRKFSSCVKCCGITVPTLLIFALIPLVYFMTDIAMKHKTFTDEYEMLRKETDEKYNMATKDRNVLRERMREMTIQNYEFLEKKTNEKYEVLKKEMLNIYNDITLKKDCLQIYENGQYISGIHNIQANANNSIRVYCDQITDGGGWIVFQRRTDAHTSFAKRWIDYKVGFGDLGTNFWLGNHYLNLLTNLVNITQELRIDLEDWSGNRAHAKYSLFVVGNEASKFKLKVEGYSGDAGNDLGDLNGMMFSTNDQDNDKCSCNCSNNYGSGGWWFYSCFGAHLNSQYCIPSENCQRCQNINWQSFRNCTYSLKRTEMKIRRRDNHHPST